MNKQNLASDDHHHLNIGGNKDENALAEFVWPKSLYENDNITWSVGN